MTKPIVIIGPTAIGKTKLAIELAKTINAEIISADSMQVYKLMNIGTAKPSKEEQATVKHHLIDIKNPDKAFSAGEFVEEAKKLIKKLQDKGKNIIITGGTGFYIESLIFGIDQIELINQKIKKFLNDVCKEIGTSPLYEWLNVIDENWAKSISPNDCQRIKRGLSVYIDKQKPLSNFFSNRKQRQDFLIFILFASKEFLKKRIQERTKQMLKRGLINEVKRIIELGYSDTYPMKAIGYKETKEFLVQNAKNQEELYLNIVKNTLAYTKRQITFFRSRFKNATWINIEKQQPLKVILDTLGGHFS